MFSLPPQSEPLYVESDVVVKPAHEVIYQLAIKITVEPDLKTKKAYMQELREYLNQSHYVDDYLNDDLTVAALLVKNGYEAAGLLLVDRFGAHLKHVIQMFARLGSINQVSKLLMHSVNRKQEDYAAAIIGAVQSKNKINVFAMLESLTCISTGKEYKSYLIETAFQHAAFEGQTELMSELKLTYNIQKNATLLPAYAVTGDDVLASVGDPNIQHILDQVMYGYATAGNTHQVSYWIAKGADPVKAVQGYILGKHYALIGGAFVSGDRLPASCQEYCKSIHSLYDTADLLRLFIYVNDIDRKKVYEYIDNYYMDLNQGYIQHIYTQAMIIKAMIEDSELSIDEAINLSMRQGVVHEIIAELAVKIVNAENAVLKKYRETELMLYLNCSHSVDEWADADDCTAAAKLARAGEHRAALLLIDKFGAKVDPVIYVYASLGKKKKMVKELIQRADKPSAYIAAIKGAVLAKDEIILPKIIKLVNKKYATNPSRLDDIFLQGRMQAVTTNNDSKLSLFGTSIYPNNVLSLHAARGDVATVRGLIGPVPSRDSSIAAIQGYIRAKKYMELTFLISGDIDLQNETLKIAIQLFEFDYANQLLDNGASINVAVEAYAELGNIDHVSELLLRGANPYRATSGYIKGEHYYYLNYYLKDCVSYMIEEINRLSYESKLRLFTYLRDPDLVAELKRRFDYDIAFTTGITFQTWIASDDLDYQELQLAFSMIADNINAVRRLHNVSFQNAAVLQKTPTLSLWLALDRNTHHVGFLSTDVIDLVISYVGAIPLYQAETLRQRVAPLHDGLPPVIQAQPKQLTARAGVKSTYPLRQTPARVAREGLFGRGDLLDSSAPVAKGIVNKRKVRESSRAYKR